MKIYKNVLSDLTLENVEIDFLEKMKQHVWRSSQFTWGDKLIESVVGHTLITLPNHGCQLLIKNDLKEYLPDTENIEINYCIWTRNSAVSIHDDPGNKFAATIYLNDEWNINDGGLFLWKENEEIRGICPENNTMVLNTERQWHLVTPVSPLSEQNRFTIQIWGLKYDE